MGLYEFLRIPEHEQFDLIFQKGIFLDSRIDGKKRFNLYAIDMFFVEVEYNNEINKVVNKTVFKTGKLLDAYAKLPDIK